MSNYCVTLDHITKKFGRFTAVDDLSLKLVPGKFYGLIGPNGAGKSTTMAMIIGALQPTSGTGSVQDHPLASEPALRQLGYSPEFPSFYTDMSCLEYLWYMGQLAGLSSDEAFNRAAELITQFHLDEHKNDKVAKFSTGMKKKIGLAQAMISHPSILLLDEPTANLDPTSRQEILSIVRQMVHEQHLTVIISSHVLTELQMIIDHVIMIDHGKLILDAPIAEAQQTFNQGVLIVQTDHDEQLALALADYKSDRNEQGSLRFHTDQLALLKKQIVKIVYENGWQLNRLSEEELSLDNLYKQMMEEERSTGDEKHSIPNA
jgi:ABC-type multidrug transport system ATPase subunit